ncbi:MAG: alpha/beta fold hydrolase [Verrucomicrobia bacterium]|nr:alpha/beta fold hydrolase [Verrucomicrobiota bacterium]
MAAFTHDGIEFHYEETGSGLPFFFQHGLGADVSQPFGLFKPPFGIRLLAFDARAHGRTQPVGPREKISLATFAGDLLALIDFLKIQRGIIGGISMGAAIALNFALRYPDRVRGLVLSRPAWLDRPNPWNVKMFALVARLICEHGPQRGLERFLQTPAYAETARLFPDTAKSLRSQFEHPRARENAVNLERIPQDTPGADRSHWTGIRVPTLVLANRSDPIHPFEYGETLARIIPNAEFQELTSKSVSVEQHGRDVQRFIEDFLDRQFLKRG